MEISSATSIGCIRSLNEDSFFVSEPDNTDTVFAIVADGMGGHNAGEVASENAVEILKKDIQERHGESPENILIGAISEANTKIYEMSKKGKELSGMGTTITACVIEKNTVTAAQVGDSRLYLIRGDEINQITKDHSLVEMLIDSGAITKEEAKNHPQKNVITRAIGTDETVEADFYEFKTKKGDVILLCSDGLVNMLDDTEILSVVKSSGDFKSAANTLVENAEKAGGTDNITVVLIKFN